MISYLRHKTIQRGLFLALCVLIIPGFVFLSISNDPTANATAGTIGHRKIKVPEYIRNFEAMRRELEVFGGIDLSRVGDSVDLEGLAWHRILLVQAAKDAGIKVTDQEVIAWIQEQPVFQENGAFSEERYKLIVDRYLKIDPKRFEDESREYLSLQRYRDQIRGTYVPQESELRESFRRLYGPRRMEYVIFTKDNVPAPAAPSEEELQAMYTRFSGRLMSQEAAQVRYLTLDAAPTAEDSSAEAGRWETESVRTPFVARGDVIPGIGVAPAALTEAIFALKSPGERTAWLEHEGKQYRFELVEKKAQAPMAYEDAKIVLTDLVNKEKTFNTIVQKASAFHESLEKTDWTKAVAAEKLEVQKAESWLPGDYLEKVGKLGRVSEALAEVKAGNVSDPLPTSNGLAIFKVISQSEPDSKLFDEKRAELEKRLKLRHEMDVFEKTIGALQATLKINTDVLAKLFPAKYAESAAPVSK